MGTPTTSRRQLLRHGVHFAVSSAVIASGAVIADDVRAATGVSPGLSQLIAEHEAADRRLNRFYVEEFNPAVERQHAMIAAIPHVEMSGGTSMSGAPITYTTADRMSVAGAKGIAGIDRRHQSTDPPWQERLRRARSFYAAHLRRERAIARTERDSGAAAVSAREVELCASHDALRDAIRAFPATSLADLSAKLAWIEQDGGMDGEDLLPLVTADVARVSGSDV